MRIDAFTGDEEQNGKREKRRKDESCATLMCSWYDCEPATHSEETERVEALV